LAAAVAALLLAGALEASSVGMLVPLLSSLTGAGSSDFLSRRLSLLVPELGPARTVLLLAALTFALIALKNAVSYGAVLLCTRLRREGTTKLRALLVEQVLHGNVDVLEKRTTGELMNVFLTEAARTSVGLDHLILLTQRSIVALSYVVAILFISWQLTLLGAALGLGLGVAGLLLSRRLLRQGEGLSSANTALAKRLSEISGGLRLIRTTHSERREMALFDHVNREQAGAEIALSRTQSLLSIAIETLAVAAAMALTAIAYRWFLAENLLSAAGFLAFGFGLLRLLPAVNQLYGLQVLVVALSGAIRPTLDMLDLPRHPARPFGREKLRSVERGIEFDNVSYSYPGGSSVLRNLSFSIPRGSFLAVVGPSGTGKTTLATLLLRLREPQAGVIRIDGRNYWDFEPESYAARVAYVEQDPFMFNATIAENIVYGAPAATRADVQRMLGTLQLGDLVGRLPAGIDTVLAERGSSLSGGERQRLAVARALLHSPEIIVMDEPTSALDADTEREVVGAIEQARIGRTLIVIAHRPSTIERADLVLDLGEGRIKTREHSAPRAAASQAR
jgi:ABC-type multidrug transport system fused ATPase/permease subunit